MTLEELTAEVARLSGELETTNANNAKLVREKREALTRAETAEASIETANTATLSDLDKAIKRAEKAESDLKVANERADASDKSLRTTRADHAISKAISEANVDAKHVRAATAILKLDMNFDDEGNALIEGKSVSDYAKSYFAKDGLAYVRAADNSGGITQGNTSTKAPAKLTAKPTTPAEWDILDAMDKAERNAFADSINAPDLKV